MARKVFLLIRANSSEQKEDLDGLISLLDGFSPHRSEFLRPGDLLAF